MKSPSECTNVQLLIVHAAFWTVVIAGLTLVIGGSWLEMGIMMAVYAAGMVCFVLSGGLDARREQP